MRFNKDKLNGIKYRTWMYFLTFSLLIMLLFLVVQIYLFEPYYQHIKLRDAKTVTEELSSNIDSPEQLSEIAINNDGCALIVNNSGNVQAVDSIGVSCLLYQDGKVVSSYIDELRNSDSGEIKYLVNVNKTKSMIIYGNRFINEEGKETLVLFNTNLQPLKSTTSIIKSQYVYLIALIIIISILLSLFYSNELARPMLKMRYEADKLKGGNYSDVHFDEEGQFNELNELSATLNSSARELSKITEIRTDLFANVSHDIKTPLTMIKAYAEMIRDITGDDKTAREKNIDIILNECNYLDSLVNDMSEMTRIQSGTIKLNIQTFDLSNTIESVVDAYRTLAKDTDIKIVTSLEPEALVVGDEFRIKEVLYNFIGNALRHYGQDKQIKIKTFATDNDNIRIEVIDHGNGISQDQLDHIWERYYKTDKQYKRSETGSGLGLAISRAILEQHNTVYGVSSELGKGSTFYFELKRFNVTNL